VGNSTPAPSETPEPIVTYYVGDPSPYAKFHHDTITPFNPQICENAHQVTRLFFRFFLPPTAKIPAPIFTINTSNDVISRKDVRFGGPKNFTFRPHFPPKAIFCLFSMGLKKISRQKGLNNGDAHL